MKNIIAILVITLVAVSPAFSQKYFTKSGKVNFYQKTTVEPINATTNQATSILDAGSGDIRFKALQTSFQFDKALMQEHYNEKYVESEKYPDATFAGKITNLAAVDFKKDGTYTAKVSGDLTMHGTTKKVDTNATITIKGGVVSANAKFAVALKDFNISIPSAVKNQLKETVDITVDATYAPYNK